MTVRNSSRSLTFAKSSDELLQPISNASNTTNTTGNLQRPTMASGSMMSAMYNEYSDLEDNEDEDSGVIKDEENEREIHDYTRNTQLSTSQPRSSNATQPSEKYSRYGIGAKLMMKMGYQEGKGLGTDQSGIVKPIETFAMHGRAGIGSGKGRKTGRKTDHEEQSEQKLRGSRRERGRGKGKGKGTGKEKAYSAGDFNSSDESMEVSDYSDEEQLAIKRLRSKIYNKLVEFENLKIDVPQNLKNWLENRDWDFENNSKFERVYQKLDTIYSLVTLTDRKDQLLELRRREESDYEETINSMTVMLETLKIARDQKISVSSDTTSNDDDDEEEEEEDDDDPIFKLAAMKVSNLELQESVILTLVKDKLEPILAINISDIEQQQSKVIPILQKICKLFLSFTQDDKLCQYDALLYQQYSEEIENIFQSNLSVAIDMKNNSDDVVASIFSAWSVNSPFADSAMVFELLFQGTLWKRICLLIEQWEPCSGIVLARAVEDYLTIVSHLGDKYQFNANVWIGKACKRISDKVKRMVNHNVRESMWSYLFVKDGHNSHVKHIRDQLFDIKTIWLPQIASHSQTDASEILILMEEAFAHVIYSQMGNLKSLFAIAFMFYDVMKLDSSILVVQYGIFNRWIEILIRLYKSDPMQVPEWYAGWYNYLTIDIANEVADETSVEVKNMIMWYLTKALDLIECKFDIVECEKLPMLYGQITPGVEELLHIARHENVKKEESVSTVTNVSGIPSKKFMTTFKDVLAGFCADKQIVMKNTRNLFHSTKGFSIMSFENSQKLIVYGYIDDDVLWVHSNNSGDIEDGEYEPISLDKLPEYFFK
ncbi:hypothetical protein PVL30_001479 [Lodderomyces elongisporus]|uniref:uncharacterized protein n=1 Tax=Lodderomyces elongisporus TaxID=36914 RepID=UPI00291EFD54|nr:uncharacterized protein PVL30_001479 [Lodderomyces elongisporus]WLF77759.1 hypothetical protein PVL30_001479 [Lodderomyces elongisporus]